MQSKKDKFTTEITQGHKTQIEEIIKSMECPKGFECYNSEFENLCKTQIFQDGELVECFEARLQPCKFSFHFGLGYFCRCPLRRYAAKNFNR